MADFTIIETQEQLNEVIGDRLKRQEEKIKESYTGYMSPEDQEKLKKGFEEEIAKLQKQFDEDKEITAQLKAQIEAANAEVSKAKLDAARIKIATEYGIPIELSGRLMGDSEEALREDAKALSQFAAPKQVAPPFNPEKAKGSAKEEALQAMADALNFD